jgi:eukaryotic-like serine/threonine-protein kinase
VNTFSPTNGGQADVEAVVLKLLAKEPAGRYGSATEVESALAGCASAGDWTDAHAADWWAGVEAVSPDAPGDPTVTATGGGG